MSEIKFTFTAEQVTEIRENAIRPYKRTIKMMIVVFGILTIMVVIATAIVIF